MGETQIYSQRLHGINEKRRILEEVDRIQRELEQQRLKLQQLKRKSLRDRWLMDGVVPPSPGSEADNPFSETEGEIRKLELQLENLQSELTYLENPELRVLKATKVQAITLLNVVNGDGNQKQADQNENHKETSIREEDDYVTDGQEEDPAGSTVSTTLSTEEPVDHPIITVRKNNPSAHDQAEKNLNIELTKEADQAQPSQGVNGSDQKEVDGEHKPFSHETDLLNSEHSLQDQEERYGEQDLSTQDYDSDDGHDDKVQSFMTEELNSLKSTLETEEQDLKSSTKELGNVSVNFNLQPTPGNEDLNDSLVKQDGNQQGESLLDEITKLVDFKSIKENEPSSTEEHGQEPTFAAFDHINVHKEEGAVGSVLASHGEGSSLDGQIMSLMDKETKEINLLDAETSEKPTVASLKFDMTEISDQTSALVQEITDSTQLPSNQSPALLPANQEEHTKLPCTDRIPSPSLPHEDKNLGGQVQISQVLVVAPPGHDLNSKQDTSASSQPRSKETTTPESQPLLQKPPETDGHQGANTAETRDKSTPEKKKSCQCCVVM